MLTRAPVGVIIAAAAASASTALSPKPCMPVITGPAAPVASMLAHRPSFSRVCTRRALLAGAVTGALAQAGVGEAAAASRLAVGDGVCSGVLQASSLKLPAGATAVITARVVGRNTKGPLATLHMPLESGALPVSFTMTRSSLRDGVPDYLWEQEDIYLRCDVVDEKGATLATGRSKAKAVAEEQPTHETAYITLE